MEHVFDEWVDGAPTGTQVHVATNDRVKAMLSVVQMDITWGDGRPIVPLFCPMHGTIAFGPDLIYQLRTDQTYPEPVPNHPFERRA